MANIPSKTSDELKDKYSVESNTYIQKVKDIDADRLEVEVGDLKQADFYPQAKLKRWDNEVNLSVRLKDFGTAEVKEENGKIKWVEDKKECHFYDHAPDEINEDGAYEFEVLLKEKPSSNVLEFSIETKGLDFFYQPELTEQEKSDGAVRPENVIGSYAVYHKEKQGNYDGGKEYKTGKAFHIFRPKIIDANGDWVWGELNVDENKKLLTVSIPQDFLDKGSYPILVDPTFGYTTAGASDYSPSGKMIGTYYGMEGTSGTVSKISLYSRDYSQTWTLKYKTAIYRRSDSVKLGETEELTNQDNNSVWEDFNFSSGVAVEASTNYFLMFAQDGSARAIYFDGGGTDCWGEQSITYPTLPDTATFTGTTGDYKISIYATYTESGGGTTFDASAQALTFSIPAYTASAGAVISAGVQALTFSVPAYSVVASDVLIYDSTQTYDTANYDYDGGVLEGTIVEPSAQVLTFAIQAYSVSAGAVISPSVQALTFSIPAHTVAIGTIIPASAQALTFSVPSYSIVTGANITPSSQTLTFNIPAYTPTAGANISVSVQSATFSVPAYSISAPTAVSASAQTLTFSIPSYSIVAGTVFSAEIQALTMTLPAYSVSVGYVLWTNITKNTSVWTNINKS